MNEYFFICKYESCHKYFDKPVKLPCGHSVCQHHVPTFDENENKINKFKCNSCRKEHEIPDDGFPLNAALYKNISLNQHLIGRHKEVKKRFDQLEEMVHEFKSKGLSDQDNYVYEFCSTIRNQVDLHREELIAEIQKNSDKIINQLDEFEKECKSNKENIDQIDLDDFKIKEINDILRKSKLNKDELEQTIERIDSTIYDFQHKIESFKNKLKLNKAIYFKPSFDKSFGQLIIDETKTPTCSLTLKNAHEKSISSLCIYDKKDQFITGSFDGKIKIWKSLNDETKCEQVLDAHEKQITSMILVPNKPILISASRDSIIKFWNLKTNTCLKTIKENSPTSCLCIVPIDKMLIVGTYAKYISMYDLISFERIYSFTAHTEYVNCLKTVNEYLFASGSKDKLIKIWNGKHLVQTLKGHDNVINCLEVKDSNENNKDLLLSGSTDRTIRVWIIQTGECINKFDFFNESILSIKFITNNFIAIGTAKDLYNLKIYDFKNKAITSEIKGHNSNINGIDLFKNNIFISCSSDGTIKQWNF